jgi:hypothetical protein
LSAAQLLAWEEAWGIWLVLQRGAIAGLIKTVNLISSFLNFAATNFMSRITG